MRIRTITRTRSQTRTRAISGIYTKGSEHTANWASARLVSSWKMKESDRGMIPLSTYLSGPPVMVKVFPLPV
eukprot:scaffold34944_cov20-Prasinocladus_malaysianus.AAC.1